MSARQAWQEEGPSCIATVSGNGNRSRSAASQLAGPQRPSRGRYAKQDRRGRVDTRVKRDRKGYMSHSARVKQEEAAARREKREAARMLSTLSGGSRHTSGIPQIKRPTTSKPCTSKAGSSVFDFDFDGDSRSPEPRGSVGPPTAKAHRLGGTRLNHKDGCSTLKTFGRGACSVHVFGTSLAT